MNGKIINFFYQKRKLGKKKKKKEQYFENAYCLEKKIEIRLRENSKNKGVIFIINYEWK